MERMQRVLAAFRAAPPTQLANIAIQERLDYETQWRIPTVGERTPLAGPKSDLMFLHLAIPGHRIAVRPSGTEPKLKFYLFASLSHAESQNLAPAVNMLQDRLQQIETELRAYVEQIV